MNNCSLILSDKIIKILESVRRKISDTYLIDILFKLYHEKIDNYVEWIDINESYILVKSLQKDGTIRKPIETKITRAIKDIFYRNNIDVPNHKIEEIGHIIKSFYSNKKLIEVKGKDILKFYNRKNYAYPGLSEEERQQEQATQRTRPSEHIIVPATMFIDEIEPQNTQPYEGIVNDTPEENVIRENEPISNNTNIRLNSYVVVPVDQSLSRSYDISSSSNGHPSMTTGGSRSSIERNINEQIKGTLSKSCMRYSYCEEYLKIYEDNEDKVSMLILLDDNSKLLARALVWKLDNGRILMDRIYYSDESEIFIFENHAINNGWDYAITKTFPGDRMWCIKGENYNNYELRINLKHNIDYPMPYIDTFCYYDWNKKEFTNSHQYIKNLTSLDFRSTNGKFKLSLDKENKISLTNEEAIFLIKNNNERLFEVKYTWNLSEETINTIIEYSYRNGYNLGNILNPYNWKYEKWKKVALKACQLGCPIYGINISNIQDEFMMDFINDESLRNIKKTCDVSNINLKYLKLIVKEYGFESLVCNTTRYDILESLDTFLIIEYLRYIQECHNIEDFFYNISTNEAYIILDAIKSSRNKIYDNTMCCILSFCITKINKFIEDSFWKIGISEDEKIKIIKFNKGNNNLYLTLGFNIKKLIFEDNFYNDESRSLKSFEKKSSPRRSVPSTPGYVNYSTDTISSNNETVSVDSARQNLGLDENFEQHFVNELIQELNRNTTI